MKKNIREIETILKNADELLGNAGLKANLVLIGGSAFILHGLTTRSTYDIDFVNKEAENVIKLLESLDINNRAQIFDDTFGDFSSDSVEYRIPDLKNIDLRLVNRDRLLVSRLFSRKRYEDFINVFNNEDILIEKEKFESMFEEIHHYAKYNYSNELKENIYLIKEAYELKGWDYETSRVKKLCEEETE